MPDVPARRPRHAAAPRVGCSRRRPPDVPHRGARRARRRRRGRRRGADVDGAVGDHGAPSPTSYCSTYTCRTAAGARCCTALMQQLPDVRFLALSVSDAAEDVIGVIRAGARGYVTKTITGAELADAIVRVPDGDAVFSPRLAGFVLDAFAATPTCRRRRGARPDHRARARGAAADRSRLRLQGDRRGSCSSR